MEVEELQAQACNNNNNNNNAKFPINKLGQKGGHDHHRYNPGDKDDLGDQIKRPNTGPTAIDGGNGGNRLRGWHHSSRIIRVSRASGGKDRHSKVWTSKGLRDRRVRLSVTTAIQFYDLQDRLGYDQPSKAVEWLINAASDAIAELPSLNSSFPDTPKQLSDEKGPSVGTEQGFDSAEVVELELDQGEANYQQHLSLPKSACSSTSETSKGSGLSLSRSGIRVNRVKARERARERAAKEKEKENSDSRIPHPHPHLQNHHHHHHHQNINPISHNPSFTELLTAGINTVNNNSNNNNESPSPTTASDQPNLFHKSSTAMAATAATMQMDYFTAGLLGLSSSRNHHHHHSSGFAGLPMAMPIPQPFSVVSGSSDGHAPVAVVEAVPQHFSFVPEQLIATTSSHPNGNGGDYSLNFSISSSGLAGFNRGTLQSNSSPSSFLPHLQRFASPIDGTTNVPFFIGAAAAAPPMENHHHHHPNHHQFPGGFDGRLQLYYGDGSRHLDQKGKGKN